MKRTFILAIITAAAPLAGGQELSREAIPGKWIAEHLPEKLPEQKHPAYFDEIDKARAQVFGGRYKLALLTLKNAKGSDPVQVALVRAGALAPLGKKDEAIAALSIPAVANDPKVQVLRARTMASIGNLPGAVALLKQHVEKNPDSLPGRYYLAEIGEKAGDLPTARAQYDWIHQKHWDAWQGQGEKAYTNAEEVTLLGRAFDRWSTLNGAYAGNVPLHSQVFKTFTKAYDIIDRSYWPARVAAAEYYLDHGNPKEAAKELAAALAANPNDIRSHVLIGGIALETFNFDAADKHIEHIRTIDENATEADLLETRALLQQRRPADAEAAIQRVLNRQPNNIEALGLLASAYALQMKEEKVQEMLAKVEKLNPENASAYLDLAESLSAMRQYPRAEKTYRIAIERAPWMTAARNGLGLLLTQSGDEDGARKELDAAYALDPFNFRTTNYLILLDRMAKLDRIESKNFVVMYDKTKDPVIGEYFTEFLEGMHQSVCDVFKHEPEVKTYIEVFASHDEFSARITGSPWIGTVGASTGRVIALCTPRKGDNTLGTYNWAQVLRHEYTHTVTLSATENRIAHWMTEGLAVAEERTPIRWEWVPMLYHAVTKKELFSMEQLTWAFVRPKRPMDRTLAYAQSWWVCEYIGEKWGQDMLLKMMDAFKGGKTQEQVFPELLGMSTMSFSEEFFAWAEKKVAGWGYDKETSAKYDELTKKAQTMIQARNFDEALKAWQEIAKIRPVDAMPHMRLAGLYIATKQPEKALEHLVRLHQVSLKDNRYAKRIARLTLAAPLNDTKKAEQYAMEAVYVDPYDLDAHELLLEVYRKTGNEKGIERQTRVIPVLAEWIKQYRKSTLLEGAPQPE